MPTALSARSSPRSSYADRVADVPFARWTRYRRCLRRRRSNRAAPFNYVAAHFTAVAPQSIPAFTTVLVGRASRPVRGRGIKVSRVALIAAEEHDLADFVFSPSRRSPAAQPNVRSRRVVGSAAPVFEEVTLDRSRPDSARHRFNPRRARRDDERSSGAESFLAGDDRED